MPKYFMTFVRASLFAALAGVVFSCTDADDFADEGKTKPSTAKANTFNFSTTQEVDLFVDLSELGVYGPTRFSIYHINPVAFEDSDEEYVDEKSNPLFSAYTDEKGVFDQTIKLPAYAKTLHIVVKNIVTGLRHTAVDVANGEAKFVFKNPVPASKVPLKAKFIRQTGLTNSLDLFSNLSRLGKSSKYSGANTQIYKTWHTPLGMWDASNGRPDYLLDKATANPALIPDVEEVAGMYQTVCDALVSGKNILEAYGSSADLTLIKDAEVSITVLGSMTCWNSSLGYYYYNDSNRPKTHKDLNVIMLFPNTQDGKRYEKEGATEANYNGNIGVTRGDIVQLMYYPNIAKGDYSNASKVFPKGTKIGFLLKANSWGCIDQDHSFNWKGWKTALNNVWASSTDGFSYCNPSESYTKPNRDFKARTAKFAYTSPKGNDYAVISFEDCCDDLDFDDLAFALNPANVFAELQRVEQGKSSEMSVYAFEDQWPANGDYDMNDAVIELKHEMIFQSSNVKKEVFDFTTYQNYVEKANGLAVRLITKVTPQSVKMYKNGKEVTFNKVYDSKGKADVYYITNNITTDLGSTYTLEVEYAKGQTLTNLAEVQPFIWRDEKGENGETRRWEVHIPMEMPTDKMDLSYFGTKTDASDVAKGLYYVRTGDYPFAFHLNGSKAEDFLETILNSSNENTPISSLYSDFLPWSKSHGTTKTGWYLRSK